MSEENITMEFDRKLFLEEKIGILLFKFTFPAALAMISIAIASLIDTIIIGRYVGTAGLASLTLALPVFMLFSALAATIGIGGAAVWSVDVGSNNYQRAEKVFGNSIMLNILTGLLITVLGITFIEPIMAFLGTPEDVYPYAKGYLSIFFPSGMFIIFAIGTNNFIRAEGMANTAMTIILIAVFLNVLLDILFVIIYGWGIEGAAYAALLAHLLAGLFILNHFLSGYSKIKLKKTMLIPDIKIMLEIIQVGTASFLRQFSIGIMHFIVNISIVWYAAGPEAGMYLAIAGISMKCIMFILMPVIGVIQGMQPIIGFNYGAKAYIRAKKTIILAIATAFCIASIIWLFIMIFPAQLLGAFSHDQILITKGQDILRLLILVLPLVAAQTTGAGLFQILKKPIPASFFAILRQVLLMVPIILLLPGFLGLNGVWYAVPIADFLACLITAVWVIREIRILDNLNAET
jgi:putative MATE family efflux protein